VPDIADALDRPDLIDKLERPEQLELRYYHGQKASDGNGNLKPSTLKEPFLPTSSLN
jgi:hypothetical protein